MRRRSRSGLRRGEWDSPANRGRSAKPAGVADEQALYLEDYIEALKLWCAVADETVRRLDSYAADYL
jgi:hypothetical protein